MPAPTTIYLGDSVYAEMQSGEMVKLTTYNGYLDDPRNVIYMDLDVLKSLADWLGAHSRDARDAMQANDPS